MFFLVVGSRVLGFRSLRFSLGFRVVVLKILVKEGP